MSRTRPPLVLLHGWGLDHRVWAPLRQALPVNWSVVAPDLPGHGSAAPLPVAALAAWTDHLARSLPDGAVVCGWSLGAMIALDLARRHAEKVDRLILIGASPRFVIGPDWPHGLDEATVTAFRAGFEADPAATLQRFVALQTLGDAHRREVAAALKAALAATAAPAQAGLAAGLAILAEADLRAGVETVSCPVRLLHGASDALMPPAAAEWLSDRLPKSCLSVFGDCGHAPFLSRPVDCAVLMESFSIDD